MNVARKKPERAKPGTQIFNPSGDPTVEAIKRKCADLIDEIHELRTNQPNAEIARMASLAITEIQAGQMWAVKAATWKF
jgi:hypothetical protein